MARAGAYGEPVTPPDSDLSALPGGDLVAAGLRDLAVGRMTIGSMLVASAAGRLRELGFRVPASPWDAPERRLYELVEAEVGPNGAHGRYNALRRRLVSFLHSARLDAASGRR